MDDWDLLFLQAAGKGGGTKLKRSVPEDKQLETHPESNSEPRANTPVGIKSDRALKNKKVKRARTRGMASRCLRQAGFRFSESVHFKSESFFAAKYLIVDTWGVEGRDLTIPQTVIRKMFVLVRNSRAVGFAPSKKSTTPIHNAYVTAKKQVQEWLYEMQSLMMSCPEVILTKQHIKDSINAVKLLSKGGTESDCKVKGAAPIETKKIDGTIVQQNDRDRSLNSRVTCLRLIACLDSIYGELLVAALDAGTSLPDPRLYLESLCGLMDNCVISSKETIGTSSTSGVSINRPGKGNPLLRYLELRAIEASALTIPALSKAAADLEGLSIGPDEGTMRGKDPLSCPTVRAWWHAVRFRVAAWSAFACPGTQAIAALKVFSQDIGVLEMGAGAGYWALMLRNAGVDVLAYDKLPPTTVTGQKLQHNPVKKITNNEYHGRFDAWSAVSYGDAASPSNTNRVLLLCYPPPDDPMAVRSLKGYTGSHLAHVGEIMGDTGTMEFEALLAAQWELSQDPISLPNFGNTCYALTLWTRREKGKRILRLPTSPSVVKCAGCNGLPHQKDEHTTRYFYCDRLIRSVWACCLDCTRSDGARAALRWEVQSRHIGYGMSEDPSQDDHLWKRLKL